MNNKQLILNVMRSNGTRDALDLRERSPDMDGTALIAEEEKIPRWKPGKDYSEWLVGSPVTYDGQVYALLQPHNASHYPESNPANTPALWSIRHTKNPKKAKPFVAPQGTSGMYMNGDCCVMDGVYRCNHDNCVYSPAEYPAWWGRID